MAYNSLYTDNSTLFPHLVDSDAGVGDAIQAAFDRGAMPIGSIIQTAAYHEGSDLGGCIYRVVAAATGTDDGGSYIDFTGFQLEAVFGESISYYQFGAKGVGADEGAAIAAAHAAANSKSLPVAARSGTFALGSTRGIPIATDVDWRGASFVVDQALTPASDGQVFTIATRGTTTALPSGPRADILAEIHAGVRSLTAFADYVRHFCRVVDAGVVEANRRGPSASAGVSQEDFFVAGPGGRVVGDITHGFAAVTYASVRPLDDPITIAGGHFDLVGVAGAGERRGLFYVTRDNTTFTGQQVALPGGDAAGQCEGAWVISDCAYVTIQDVATPPRRPVTGSGPGTYAFKVLRSIGVRFVRCGSDGSASDTWGAMMTDRARDLLVENCRLSRVDSHRLAWNVTIRDSALGEHGVQACGGGRLTIHNTTVERDVFLELRPDYGAHWRGDIVITDSALRYPFSTGAAKIIEAEPFDSGDFGYQITQGYTIEVTGFKIDYSAGPAHATEPQPIALSTIQTVGGQAVRYPHNIRLEYVETGRSSDYPIPSGGTSGRPTSPIDGETYWYTDLAALVRWDQNADGWEPV